MSEEPSSSARAVGICWYRVEDWGALRALFTDGSTLPADWLAWEAIALAEERSAHDAGRIVVRAEIRPEPFAAWCRGEAIAPDTMARRRWANERPHLSI